MPGFNWTAQIIDCYISGSQIFGLQHFKQGSSADGARRLPMPKSRVQHSRSQQERVCFLGIRSQWKKFLLWENYITGGTAICSVKGFVIYRGSKTRCGAFNAGQILHWIWGPNDEWADKYNPQWYSQKLWPVAGIFRGLSTCPQQVSKFLQHKGQWLCYRVQKVWAKLVAKWVGN